MNKFYQITESSLKDAGVKSYQELWEKVKGEYKGFEVNCSSKVKTINKDNYSLDAIFSTDSEDRHGDVVMQNWDLKSFKLNPVILNSHNYHDATEVVGRADKISVKEKKLQGKIVFAVEENPKAKIIFALYAGGFLNAFSVGFMVKQWDDKGQILKSELLEISAVSVPANAEALVKAIDIDKLYAKSDNQNDLPNKDGKKPNADKQGDDNETGGEEDKNKDKSAPGDNDPKDKDGETPAEAPKSADQIIQESVDEICNQKLRCLKKIYKAIELVSEALGQGKSKEQTENNQLINQSIRKLIKLKD